MSEQSKFGFSIGDHVTWSEALVNNRTREHTAVVIAFTAKRVSIQLDKSELLWGGVDCRWGIRPDRLRRL